MPYAHAWWMQKSGVPSRYSGWRRRCAAWEECPCTFDPFAVGAETHLLFWSEGLRPDLPRWGTLCWRLLRDWAVRLPSACGTLRWMAGLGVICRWCMRRPGRGDDCGPTWPCRRARGPTRSCKPAPGIGRRLPSVWWQHLERLGLVVRTGPHRRPGRCQRRQRPPFRVVRPDGPATNFRPGAGQLIW